VADAEGWRDGGEESNDADAMRMRAEEGVKRMQKTRKK